MLGLTWSRCVSKGAVWGAKGHEGRHRWEGGLGRMRGGPRLRAPRVSLLVGWGTRGRRVGALHKRPPPGRVDVPSQSENMT